MVNERTIRIVKSMYKKGIPFIIQKYGVAAFGISNNLYELLYIKTDRIETRPLERDDAQELITKLGLPILHYVDSRNTIWGDENFKKKYHELKANGYEYDFDDC